MEYLHVRFQIQNWLNSGLKKKSTQRQRCCKESKTFPYTERKMSWSDQIFLEWLHDDYYHWTWRKTTHNKPPCHLKFSTITTLTCHLKLWTKTCDSLNMHTLWATLWNASHSIQITFCVEEILRVSA